MQWLDALTLFSTLLMCGNELAVSAFLNPALWKRNDWELTGELAASLGAFMPPWYAINLGMLGVEAYLRRQEPGRLFILGSALLWAAVIVCTLSLLVPLNNRLASMNTGGMLAEWKQISRKWDTLHRFRVVLLTLAVALFYHGIPR